MTPNPKVIYLNPRLLCKVRYCDGLGVSEDILLCKLLSSTDPLLSPSSVLTLFSRSLSLVIYVSFLPLPRPVSDYGEYHPRKCKCTVSVGSGRPRLTVRYGVTGPWTVCLGDKEHLAFNKDHVVLPPLSTQTDPVFFTRIPGNSRFLFVSVLSPLWVNTRLCHFSSWISFWTCLKFWFRSLRRSRGRVLSGTVSRVFPYFPPPLSPSSLLWHKGNGVSEGKRPLGVFLRDWYFIPENFDNPLYLISQSPSVWFWWTYSRSDWRSDPAPK